MLGALVAGVRRAFPYVDVSEVEAVIDTHSDALFRITHTAPLGVSLQARLNWLLLRAACASGIDFAPPGRMAACGSEAVGS